MPVGCVADEQVVEDPEGFMDPYKDVRIRVHRCSDLKRADGFLGKSDPYAVVYWNDEKVGTTKVIDDDLDPVWDEDMPIRVPLESMNSLVPPPYPVIAKVQHRNDWVVCVISGGHSFVAKLSTSVRTSEQVVQVFDYDKVGDHEFLGQIDLYGMGDEALPIYETSYALGPRQNFDQTYVLAEPQLCLAIECCYLLGCGSFSYFAHGSVSLCLADCSLIEKIISHDWHVGGKITLSVGTAGDAATPWGINGYGRLVPLTPAQVRSRSIAVFCTPVLQFSDGADAAVLAQVAQHSGGDVPGVMPPVRYRVVVFTQRSKGAGTKAKVLLSLHQHWRCLDYSAVQTHLSMAVGIGRYSSS